MKITDKYKLNLDKKYAKKKLKYDLKMMSQKDHGEEKNNLQKVKVENLN